MFIMFVMVCLCFVSVVVWCVGVVCEVEIHIDLDSYAMQCCKQVSDGSCVGLVGLVGCVCGGGASLSLLFVCTDGCFCCGQQCWVLRSYSSEQHHFPDDLLDLWVEVCLLVVISKDNGQASPGGARPYYISNGCSKCLQCSFRSSSYLCSVEGSWEYRGGDGGEFGFFVNGEPF